MILCAAGGLAALSDLPVKTVAARAGFASRSHFSRAFKAFAGADPAGYRAQTIRACEPGGGESPDTGIEIRKLH